MAGTRVLLRDQTTKQQPMGESNGFIIAALIAAAIGGPIAIFALLARIGAARWVIGAMLFISANAVALDWFERPQRLWLYSLQFHRSKVFLALGVLLFVAIVGHMSRVSVKKVSGLAIMLLIITCYGAFLQVFHEGPLQGVQTVAFAFATMIPLMLVAPAVLGDWDDFYPLLRMVMWVSIAWGFCVAVQFVLNRNQLTLNRGARFIGLTANPQHASVFLGVVVTVGLYLLLNDPKRIYRPLWICLLGANLILLAWTGSRTGMGMVIIGATFILYSRAGRAILLMPAAAFMAFLIFKLLLASTVDLGLERLTSTDNTRDAAWATMIRSGLSSPLVGVGVQNAGDTENSYLFAFAAYGIGMVALLGAMMAGGGIVVLQVFRSRSNIPKEHRTLADLTMAYIAMYFAAAMFEGFIMARVSPSLVFLFMFGSMAVAIRKLANPETVLLTDDLEDEYSLGEGPITTSSSSLEAGY